jgi:integrase
MVDDPNPRRHDGQYDGQKGLGGHLARKATGLSARRVQTQKAPGMFADGGGLYLRVAPLGASKSWVFRYQIAGRRRDMGLGSADTFSLAEARQKAAAARRLVVERIDPIEYRKKEAAVRATDAAKTVTFREAAERYILANQAGWRNTKHAKQWSSTLEAYVYPHFGSLPVDAIDVGLVMTALEPIWTLKPETASRVRGRVESVLDWATARGYRQGENPGRWRGHLENLLPRRTKVRRVKHFAALPYAELGSFMVALREQDGIAARALGFAILTAGRTSEVLCAKWDEINLGERLWTVPGERMKTGREHRVPLSGRATEILENMAKIRTSDCIFPGARDGKPLSNMALLMTLRRMGRGDLTAHGFRSTFSDWCAEQTNFPADVREMALAHAVGDKVEAAYRRGDLFAKRRQLAEAWGRFCNATLGSGGVVRLRAQAGP